jgi:hypothetical protein
VYLDSFAVDPAGILAPGKQDIWPRATVGRTGKPV